MDEPLSNIGVCCKGCGPKVNPKYAAYPLKEFMDKHCKIGFVHPRGTEWMWVHVFDHNETELLGLLDNDPIHVTDVSFGSGIAFTRNEISLVTPDLPNN